MMREIEDRALLCPGFAGTDRFWSLALAKTTGRETPRGPIGPRDGRFLGVFVGGVKHPRRRPRRGRNAPAPDATDQQRSKHERVRDKDKDKDKNKDQDKDKKDDNIDKDKKDDNKDGKNKQDKDKGDEFRPQHDEERGGVLRVGVFRPMARDGAIAQCLLLTWSRPATPESSETAFRRKTT